MKLASSRSRSLGFSFLELILVVVVVVVLIALLLPVSRAPGKPKRIKCVSNLRQVVLAFSAWSSDHEDKFPMAVCTNQGGTLELGTRVEAWRVFQAASNHLISPKVLLCPADTDRRPATSLGAGFDHRNLSYFVNLDALVRAPETILAGDRNITVPSMSNSTIMDLRSNSPAAWTGELHRMSGNVSLADGSVHQCTSSALQRQLQAGTNEFIRLAMPLLP
jgi:hypothetical protein